MLYDFFFRHPVERRTNDKILKFLSFNSSVQVSIKLQKKKKKRRNCWNFKESLIFNITIDRVTKKNFQRVCKGAFKFLRSSTTKVPSFLHLLHDVKASLEERNWRLIKAAVARFETRPTRHSSTTLLSRSVWTVLKAFDNSSSSVRTLSEKYKWRRRQFSNNDRWRDRSQRTKADYYCGRVYCNS